MGYSYTSSKTFLYIVFKRGDGESEWMIQLDRTDASSIKYQTAAFQKKKKSVVLLLKQNFTNAFKLKFPNA